MRRSFLSYIWITSEIITIKNRDINSVIRNKISYSALHDNQHTRLIAWEPAAVAIRVVIIWRGFSAFMIKDFSSMEVTKKTAFLIAG
ncbi:hypothetical protein CCR84_02860 [Rhodocyclus purpureus]|nr:hypothetical protein [Rhodocyclus purpureus]